MDVLPQGSLNSVCEPESSMESRFTATLAHFDSIGVLQASKHALHVLLFFAIFRDNNGLIFREIL